MTDSPRTRVNEHRPAHGCNRGRGQQVGEEEQGKGREDERDVQRQQKRWCAHDVKRPRGRAIATAESEYGEEAHAPTPSAENGVARRWRHEGREKTSRMAIHCRAHARRVRETRSILGIRFKMQGLVSISLDLSVPFSSLYILEGRVAHGFHPHLRS
jgi:hypothetical protein